MEGGGEARAKALRQEPKASREEGAPDRESGDEDKTGETLEETRRAGVWRETRTPSKGNGSPPADEWINVGSTQLRE